MRPVPTSVQDIKAAGLNSFLASQWLLTFQIATSQIGNIVARHSLAQTNYFNLQEKIDRDTFLKRVSWARSVECDSNAVFYARTEWGPPSRWVYFVVETNSSRAWFIRGYQN